MNAVNTLRSAKLVQPIPQSAGEEVFTIFAQYEGEGVTENSPEATDVKSRMLMHPSLGRVVRLDHMQPGIASPAGQDHEP